MGNNILNPFYERLTRKNVIKFGSCFDEYLHWQGEPNHAQEAQDLIRAGPDLKTAFLTLFGEFFLCPKDAAVSLIKEFIKLPLDKMPLYIIVPSEPIIKVTSICPQPLPGEGPLIWQIVTSRWRLLSGF